MPIAPREIPLFIERDGESLQVSIAEALRAAIERGQLRPGAQLPSSRDLARQLGVARGTVVAAYEQLVAEGYIRGVPGAWTRVMDTLPERWMASRQGGAAGETAQRRVTLSARGARMSRTHFPVGFLPPPRPFRPHTPAVDAFPFAIWGRLMAKHARSSRPDRLRDADVHGHRPLREAIAEYMGQYRGVSCSSEQVLITAGTQQNLDLAARLLLDEGDAAWMEDPGHFGARDVLRAAGARVVGIPVDESGLQVAAGIAAAPEARLAYVTPARQSPLGAVLSVDRRLRLLEWAHRASAWILEDDYDCEFRYNGRPLPALQALDRQGAVIHSGTFTKTMFPGLRVGYLVLPQGLVEPFTAALSIVARYTPLLPQLALTDFIVERHFARHLRRMRVLYAERREALMAALDSELGGLVEVVGTSAGLEVVALLPPGMNDRFVSKLALEMQVEVMPLSSYAVERGSRGGLVLGFAAVSPARSRAAVPVLREAIQRAQRSSR